MLNTGFGAPTRACESFYPPRCSQDPIAGRAVARGVLSQYLMAWEGCRVIRTSIRPMLRSSIGKPVVDSGNAKAPLGDDAHGSGWPGPPKYASNESGC